MFMTEAQIVAVILWCATTFLSDLLQIHAYLGITAPTKQCGKTTLVNLVALFVRQGLIVAGRVSAAYIYRAIDRLRPTFIVDESQAIFRKSPDVEDIFNAGHVRSTAYVGLVEKVNDEFVEKRFNVLEQVVVVGERRLHLQLRLSDGLRQVSSSLDELLGFLTPSWAETVRNPRRHVTASIVAVARDNRRVRG